MPVSLDQYRGTVGMFNNIFANKRCNKNSICYRRKMQSSKFGLTMILFFLLRTLPTLIGFLKINKKFLVVSQNMRMVHINKKFLISCFYLLKGYLSVQRLDIFCISCNLQIPVIYIMFLPLKLIDVNYLSETVLFQFQFGSKICNFISLYRSPSQTADNFDSFLDNLKLNVDAMTDNNPFLVIEIGDFNARSSNCYINDKSNYEGTKIDCLATEYDLKQVINKPTHLLELY